MSLTHVLRGVESRANQNSLGHLSTRADSSAGDEPQDALVHLLNLEPISPNFPDGEIPCLSPLL